MNKSEKRQRLLRIRDLGALSALVIHRINEGFDGNQKRAAEEIGLPQPTLSRITAQKTTFLRPRTYQALARLMGVRRGKLWAALLSKNSADRGSYRFLEFAFWKAMS